VYKKRGGQDATKCIRTGNNRGGVNRFTHASEKPSPQKLLSSVVCPCRQPLMTCVLSGHTLLRQTQS